VQQEAANYIAAEVRRVARSGDLRCSRSTLCCKQWKCIVPQAAANYVHADPRSREAKEVEAASKAAVPEM
jgi:hypothetical protein